MRSGSIYDKVTFQTEKPQGIYNWLGNLRWYVREEGEGVFSFSCISNLQGMTHEECVAAGMTKKLFSVSLEEPGSGHRSYGADYIQSDCFSVYMPFYEYGCLAFASQPFRVSFEGQACRKEGVCLVQNGAYNIAIDSDAEYEIEDDGIFFQIKTPGWVSFSFHIDEKKAIADSRRLLTEHDQVLADSRQFWEAYFASCPTVTLKQDYFYEDEVLGIREQHSPEAFLVRQLWHFWCVLVNVSEVEFNRYPLYIAADKINWMGTWSNDGPQCMAALSLTNQKDLAKRLLITYLTSSLTTDGILSWYTHADGVGCYGVKGDVGRFSHGAPYLPQVVAYYIRNTKDKMILSADAGGMTVYDKLKTYVQNLHPTRDLNGDSLIEWANLWETGWDDKGGSFFNAASKEEWMQVISGGTEEEIEKFYATNQNPVITIVEQVITLWSLSAMAELANEQGDRELEEYCTRIHERMIQTVEERCWNQEDFFYHDIDVRTGTQTMEKSADAFYWMNFETDQERCIELFMHLNKPEEFHCFYVPMLSKDSAKFNRHGYWNGGHWPREMSMIAMGLHHCGYDKKAMELLVRAIMVDKGNVIPEVRDAIDGTSSTPITKMACSIMIMIALLDVTEKVKWSK